MTDGGCRDGGMVTAEVAVALPALVAVVVLGLAGVGLGIDQVRCADAVRVGARLAARGQSEVEVRSAVLARSPDGARMTIAADGDRVRVEVTGPPLGALGALGVGGCSAAATAVAEGL